MKNRGVTFIKPFEVEVQEKPYPKLEIEGKKCEHGVILKIVLTAICGSDLHMYRGRTKIDSGTVLGHEITGEVIECGTDVEIIKKGDLVSVPFNVACGRCKNCKEQNPNICLSVNDKQEGGAYGYAHMGDWPGGQAEYIMIPFADFNLLRLPPLNECKSKLKDLALITDVFPTAFHAAYNAGVEIGSKVYIAGAGPIGLAAALSCKLLGAACIIVGDVRPNRLQLAQKNGYHNIDLSSTTDLAGALKKIVGLPEVDVFIDAVGFEAVGYGAAKNESKPYNVINSAIDVTRAGGVISLPGVYGTEDLGGKTADEKKGIYPIKFGDSWSKGLSWVMGQTPVMRYNRKLMEDILNDKCFIAQELNVQIISLDEAPAAYQRFEKGEAVKYIIDPHGSLK